jgi:hypothetical protein
MHAVQVWLKSVSTEVHFTHEAGRVFRAYLASHCSGVPDTSRYLLAMRHKHYKSGRDRSIEKGNLLVWPKPDFIPILPRIAAE